MPKYQGLENILLIDDDDATNYYNKYIIENLNLGVKIHTVSSGREGLDFLCCEGSYSQENCYPQPGLIFLDINMPGMDGWEFLNEYEKLDAHKKGKYVLAMLTTSLNPDDEEKAKKFNVVGNFLNKPLSEQKVMSVIEQHF